MQGQLYAPEQVTSGMNPLFALYEQGMQTINFCLLPAECAVALCHDGVCRIHGVAPAYTDLASLHQGLNVCPSCFPITFHFSASIPASVTKYTSSPPLN